jgi:hypothetical protein
MSKVPTKVLETRLASDHYFVSCTILSVNLKIILETVRAFYDDLTKFQFLISLGRFLGIFGLLTTQSSPYVGQAHH